MAGDVNAVNRDKSDSRDKAVIDEEIDNNCDEEDSSIIVHIQSIIKKC